MRDDMMGVGRVAATANVVTIDDEGRDGGEHDNMEVDVDGEISGGFGTDRLRQVTWCCMYIDRLRYHIAAAVYSKCDIHQWRMSDLIWHTSMNVVQTDLHFQKVCPRNVRDIFYRLTHFDKTWSWRSCIHGRGKSRNCKRYSVRGLSVDRYRRCTIVNFWFVWKKKSKFGPKRIYRLCGTVHTACMHGWLNAVTRTIGNTWLGGDGTPRRRHFTPSGSI